MEVMQYSKQPTYVCTYVCMYVCMYVCKNSIFYLCTALHIHMIPLQYHINQGNEERLKFQRNKLISEGLVRE